MHYCRVENISYINAHTVCVCVCVCLSPMRSWERNVILPCFFRQRKEILLVSCTNCFASLYDAWLERKSHWNRSAGYALKTMQACYTSGYPGQDESYPPLECHWNILEGYALKTMPSISWVP